MIKSVNRISILACLALLLFGCGESEVEKQKRVEDELAKVKAEKLQEEIAKTDSVVAEYCLYSKTDNGTNEQLWSLKLLKILDSIPILNTKELKKVCNKCNYSINYCIYYGTLNVLCGSYLPNTNCRKIWDDKFRILKIYNKDFFELSLNKGNIADIDTLFNWILPVKWTINAFNCETNELQSKIHSGDTYFIRITGECNPSIEKKFTE